MTEELDRSSTDANHWAKQFCRFKEKQKWSLAYIDEALMVGWFANYWAAVNDPLQKQIEELQDANKKRLANTLRELPSVQKMIEISDKAMLIVGVYMIGIGLPVGMMLLAGTIAAMLDIREGR